MIAIEVIINDAPVVFGNNGGIYFRLDGSRSRLNAMQILNDSYTAGIRIPTRSIMN